MASSHLILNKKIEDLEAEVHGILMQQNPIQPPLHHQPIIAKIHQKISFMKTLLAAEMELHPDDKPEHLDEMAVRLSILEDAFLHFANYGVDDEPFDGPVSPCGCTSSCIHENTDADTDTDADADIEAEAGEQETVISEVTEGIRNNGSESKSVILEERIKEELEDLLSKVKIENIVREVAEKRVMRIKGRRRGWLMSNVKAVGVAAVLGFAVAVMTNFGYVVEERANYLVPT